MSHESKPGATQTTLVASEKECFWLCADVGQQYGQHVLQGTSCDRAQLRRSGVFWVGECSIADIWPAEYSLGLGMEVQSPRVGGRDIWYRNWKPTRARTSEEIDIVFLLVQTVVTEGRISLGKKPRKEMLADFLTKHVDAATMLNCVSGSRLKFQSGESKQTLKA